LAVADSEGASIDSNADGDGEPAGTLQPITTVAINAMNVGVRMPRPLASNSCTPDAPRTLDVTGLQATVREINPGFDTRR
jgi:hypothetical protein